MPITGVYDLLRSTYHLPSTNQTHPDIKFNASDLAAYGKPAAKPNTVSATDFDIFSRNMICFNLAISTTLSLFASPFERARSVVQADFASLMSVQNMNPASAPVTPGVQLERTVNMKQTTFAEYPSAYNHHFETISGPSRGPVVPVQEPRWTSIFQVLKQTFRQRGFTTLGRGSSLIQVLNAPAEMFGATLVLPLGVFLSDWSICKNLTETSASMFHIITHIFIPISLYPLMNLMTRAYVDKDFLYPALAESHPKMQAYQGATIPAGRVRSMFQEFCALLRLPAPGTSGQWLTRIIDRAEQQFGNTALYRGFTLSLAQFSVYSAAFLATMSMSAPVVQSYTKKYMKKHNIPENDPPLELSVLSAVPTVLFCSAVAHYAQYPISTVQAMLLASNTAGYVAYSGTSVSIPPKHTINLNITKTQRNIPISTLQAARIAAKEVYRQAGIRGFYAGASVIPLIRLPAMAVGTVASVSFVKSMFPDMMALAHPFHHAQRHVVL